MQKPVRAEPTAVGADGEVVRELPGCTGSRRKELC